MDRSWNSLRTGSGTPTLMISRTRIPGHPFVRHGHPLQPREPAMGYAARLAAIQGVDLARFLRDMRIGFKELLRGDGDAVRGLAALRSLDHKAVESLVTYTPRREEGARDYAVAGAPMLPGDVLAGSFRVCPHCIAEDLDRFEGPVAARPWLRLEWVLSGVRACAAHGAALVDVRPDEKLHLGCDFSWTVASQVLPGLERLRAEAAEGEATTYVEWVAGRLDGAVDAGNWLDDVPLCAGMAFCQGLGISALHAPGTRPSALGMRDLARAAEEGYRIAARGRQAVETLFDRIVETQLTKKRGSVGHERIYGQVHRVLRWHGEDPAFAKFRDVLREHAFANLPLSPGIPFLGVALDERRVHNQRSAAVSSARADSSMLRLVGNGTAEAAAGRRLRIPVPEFEALVASVAGHMTNKEVSALTGLDIRQIDRLVERGVLPILPEASRPAGAYRRFLRADIDAFMARLLRDAVPVPGPSGSRVPIERARSVARVTAADVVQLVFEGKLGWVGSQGDGRRYENLLVDVDEVRAILQPARPGTGLTLTEAMARLPGIKHHSLPRLVRAGLLEYASEYRPTSLRTLKVLTGASVEAFAARYATLQEVSTALGIAPLFALRRLNGDGVREAVSFEQVRSKIYNRSDVARYLVPAPAS
ncbi:TniQ family protein [Methylobacterium sp. C33D]